MSKKVHPYAHRMVILRDWKSRWFATDKKYADFLRADIFIKEFLTKKLRKFTKKQKTVLYVLLCLLILIISISATVAYQHFQQQQTQQFFSLFEHIQ